MGIMMLFFVRYLCLSFSISALNYWKNLFKSNGLNRMGNTDWIAIELSLIKKGNWPFLVNEIGLFPNFNR